MSNRRQGEMGIQALANADHRKLETKHDAFFKPQKKATRDNHGRRRQNSSD